MSTQTPRRRRRVRGSDESATPVDNIDGAVGPHGAGEPPVWIGEAVDADSTAAERGLRGLLGSGSSQITPTAALRARDAARPRPADLVRAEEQLVIVRRRWSPRE